ncbi:MAG: hypothetical protein JNG85_09730, partial [Spirochaetaceae bacterium]|nr:hypothetical protein [Spirochaetaceae bacterium]
ELMSAAGMPLARITLPEGLRALRLSLGNPGEGGEVSVLRVLARAAPELVAKTAGRGLAAAIAP